MKKLKVEVSIGEIVDKLTILMIKSEKIKDSEKLQNVKNEHTCLYRVIAPLNISEEDVKKLYAINLKLWEIEDKIRLLEKKKDFTEYFIRLARSVYKYNDKRAEIKMTINIKYGSYLREEKYYSTKK